MVNLGKPVKYVVKSVVYGKTINITQFFKDKVWSTISSEMDLMVYTQLIIPIDKQL